MLVSANVPSLRLAVSVRPAAEVGQLRLRGQRRRGEVLQGPTFRPHFFPDGILAFFPEFFPDATNLEEALS